MHTNEIITDMVGGLLGLKKEKKNPTAATIRSLETAANMFQVYIGIMDDLPPFTGDDVARGLFSCVISGVMRFLAVRAPRRDIQPGNHGGIPLRKRVDPEN